MSDLLTKFDSWLKEDGPAALVIREHLLPVEGPDGVVFPATYAAGDGFRGGYNIDPISDSKNVCLIDSVGAQANRIEPVFTKTEYAGLVPQIVVLAGNKRVNLLEAGHRAADAIVRCSSLQQALQAAFKDVLNGNARTLAKIAPTSLVFGVWDSRDTQAKLPRLIASTIRAFDVQRLTRSAAYAPPVDHIAIGSIPDYTTDAEKEKLSKRGWLQALASATHGGVIAQGGIRRDATLHLAALRLLSSAQGDPTDLRRYVLGLCLTAFTRSVGSYLRQGCNLVLDPDPNKPREFFKVYADGRREPGGVTHADALDYAKAAARAFGLDPDRKLGSPPDQEVPFDKELAKQDINSDESASAPRKKKGAQAK